MGGRERGTCSKALQRGGGRRDPGQGWPRLFLVLWSVLALRCCVCMQVNTYLFMHMHVHIRICSCARTCTCVSVVFGACTRPLERVHVCERVHVRTHECARTLHPYGSMRAHMHSACTHVCTHSACGHITFQMA